MMKICPEEMICGDDNTPNPRFSQRILAHNDMFGYFFLKWSEAENDWVNLDGSEYQLAIHHFAYLMS